MTSRIFLLILGCFVFFASCQKEIEIDLPPSPGGGSGGGGGTGGGGGGTNNSIIGDYDFIGMSAHTDATVTVSQAGVTMKTITTSDYISENNTGTVKITANEFISTNVGYDVDTTMHVKSYMNNVLIDESDFPFVVSAPPTSATSNYTKISADSITVSGAFGVPSSPGGPAPTGTVGAKFSWAGDTLIMRVATTINQTITQGGVPASFSGTVIGISRMKKK